MNDSASTLFSKKICSLFAKGHLIYKEQLIDQWIAHNIINLTIGCDYLADICDEHFDSLVQVPFST
jgi:hypothetical protein